MTEEQIKAHIIVSCPRLTLGENMSHPAQLVEDGKIVLPGQETENTHVLLARTVALSPDFLESLDNAETLNRLLDLEGFENGYFHFYQVFNSTMKNPDTFENNTVVKLRFALSNNPSKAD